MKKIINTIIVTLTLAPLFLTGCGPAPQSGDDELKVLASTSFLADIAQNVAGDRLTVDSLLPIGADPHAYQAAPADVSKIAESDVLILNGLEYEHFIEPLLENAGGERLVIEAASGLTPTKLEESTEGEGRGNEAGDPHMWLDANRVTRYVENIRDGLIKADPAGEEIYRANAAAYIEQLIELDMWIWQQVQTIPAERRLLVTNHEALGYFAEHYGFTIVESILPSFSSEAGASAQEIAAAIEAIKSSGAPAIFLGEAENADLAEQIAAETGVQVVDSLHLESLTDGEPAPTYIAMMKHNVTQIVGALK
ncbi:MAG: metal ABC transporter substrate-binding protein [Chloroflexi bacterium]|nr:metal ABC transporter substrate-binding protein [Chloroflexota bacterium]MDL1942171.1 metal ABC transporter substrate-binding protein [Chloroflexi bacterium CFX2]